MYYKFIGDSGLFWKDSRSEWLLASSRHNYPAMIERPTVKQWSGPQDGLPPIGMRVEIFASADEYAPDWSRYADHIGQTVTVIAHQEAQSKQPIAVYSCENDGRYEYHSLVASCFKPVRTPEQQAADKRESAIRELMDIAQVDCRVTAARLVDAGFKRPSKSESRDDAVDAMELIVPHIGSVAAGKLYDAGFKREVV